MYWRVMCALADGRCAVGHRCGTKVCQLRIGTLARCGTTETRMFDSYSSLRNSSWHRFQRWNFSDSSRTNKLVLVPNVLFHVGLEFCYHSSQTKDWNQTVAEDYERDFTPEGNEG